MKRFAILSSVLMVLAGASIGAQATGAGRYTPPRTPWGHPDLQGIYTNKDEANTPLERPAEFKGRDPRSFTQAELAELVKKRQAQAAAIAGGIGGAETGAGPTHWYDHLRSTGAQPWLIVDPAVTHGLGVHAHNYSDFPLWDIVFGSFRNPASYDGRCGFESPADRRLGAMLAWQDVNAPIYGDASRGAHHVAA